ncbi:MAG TPA: TlpA disulfide reductase family protein [Candidatus Polarisedimenticolia bacterium]|jgi:thiol-disulfide isomerase/thioredoxin
MRSKWGLLLAAAALAVAAAGAASTPRVAGIDRRGFAAMLASHKGRPVVVNMWATWCDPCREEFPDLVKLHRELGGRGLRVIAISMDMASALEGAVIPFLDAQGASFPAYIRDASAENDEDFINAVDKEWSGSLPATFVYDREGRLVKRIIGPTSFVQLKAAVTPLLQAAPR